MDQEHDRPNGQDGDATAAIPGDDGPAPTTADALAASQAEALALKDQLLRALAEAENVRRRAQRDREEAGKYAIAAFARELVGVADNLRRAIAAIPADALVNDEALKNLAAGVELTERQLLSAFERFQLRGQPPGTVLQVLQPGYVLHDRLIRPAMVGVAKAAPADAGAAANQA